MKVKYDAEADILIFILQDDLPYDCISEQGSVIVSYKESQEPVSIEFLNTSKRQLFNPSETNLVVSR
jgi:uncharacterized protein YuzE